MKNTIQLQSDHQEYGDNFYGLFNWYIKGRIDATQLTEQVPENLTQAEADMIIALSNSDHLKYIAAEYRAGRINEAAIWRLQDMALLTYQEADKIIGSGINAWLKIDAAAAAYIASTQRAISRLYEFGVICLYHHSRRVQLSDETFLANFAGQPVDEERERPGDYIELSKNLNGIQFFCLVKKEKSPDKRD